MSDLRYDPCRRCATTGIGPDGESPCEWCDGDGDIPVPVLGESGLLPQTFDDVCPPDEEAA